MGLNKTESSSSVTKRNTHNGKPKNLWEHAYAESISDESPTNNNINSYGVSSYFVNLLQRFSFRRPSETNLNSTVNENHSNNSPNNNNNSQLRRTENGSKNSSGKRKKGRNRKI